MSNERAEQGDQPQEEPRIEELPPKNPDSQAAEQVKGGEGPSESISLNFTKTTYKY